MNEPDHSTLQFKQISLEHIELIHDLHSRVEVDQYNTLGIPEDIEQTRQFISVLVKEWSGATQSIYEWAVFDKQEQFIGIGGIKAANNRFRRGEIFYNLLPEHWGQGLGTQIARWLLKFGFETLNLHRIEAGVDCENTRSIHVLEKIGMVNEGVRRKILPVRGQWKDNYQFSILEGEFHSEG